MDINERRIILKIPSETNYLQRIREFIAGIAEDVGFTDGDLEKIVMSVDEACANIMEHAYTNDDSKVEGISITLISDDEKLTILLEDKGIYFDPTKAEKQVDFNKMISDAAKGGLGLYIMLNLMDKIEYTRLPNNEGNQLKLIKYFKK